MPTDNEPGFITIAPREIYETLKRLENKVDMLSLKDAIIADHETRLRKLETRFVGVAVSAVAVVLGGLVTIILKGVAH